MEPTPVHQVSPRYQADKLASRSIGDRIDVYEDRIRGWLFGPARALVHVAYAEVAILSLCLSYFEGWEQYHSDEDSNGRSSIFFRRAWQGVFPTFDFGEVGDIPGVKESMCRALYDQLRCGAAHDGIPRNKVFIGRMPAPIKVSARRDTGEIGAIMVDPYQILERIQDHFGTYVASLRDPANVELRKNFMKTWERVHAGSPILPPGPPPTP